MAIGNEVGKFMDMDLEEDGTTIGSFLRIKTLLDVNKPLRRGVMLMTEEEKPLWCPLTYEFLPEFCYTCGIIGHTDMVFDIKLPVGEEQPFSKKLCFLPEMKRWGEGRSTSFGSGRSGGSWSRGSGGNDGKFLGGRAGRSDGGS